MFSTVNTWAWLALGLGIALTNLGCNDGDKVQDSPKPSGAVAGEPGMARDPNLPLNTNAGKHKAALEGIDYRTPGPTCLSWADEAFDDSDLDTAGELYRHALERGAGGQTLRVVFRIGWCHQEDRPELALEYYNEVVRLKPDAWDAHFNRANCAFALHRINDRTRVDANGQIHTDRGALYYYNILVAEQRDKLIPVSAATWYNRARCYYLAGNLKQALKDYKDFFAAGGGPAEYAETAQSWIAKLEVDLGVPEAERFQPGANPVQ